MPSQIGSLLRPENMDAAVDSYDALSPGVKIRLLLSMLHLERHQMEDLEGTVIQIDENCFLVLSCKDLILNKSVSSMSVQV